NVELFHSEIKPRDFLFPMNGDADRSAFVSAPSHDRLPHPVGGVNNKAIAAFWIKAPCRTLKTHERHLEDVLRVFAFLHVPCSEAPHVRQVLVDEAFVGSLKNRDLCIQPVGMLWISLAQFE